MDLVLGTVGHVYSAIRFASRSWHRIFFPLVLQENSSHDLRQFRVNSDIKDELITLGENIDNAKSVVKPIAAPEDRLFLPTETVELFLRLEQAIEQAREAAKRISNAQSRNSTWAVPATISNIFSLRPTKDVDELKWYSSIHDKMVSLINQKC